MLKKTFLLSAFCFLISAATAAAAESDWLRIAPGVDYREYKDGDRDIFVTRIDLTNPQIQVVTTPQGWRGMTVSDFARKNHAIAAINGDYFDPKFVPRGLTISHCDQWAGAKDNPMHEWIVAVSEGLGAMQPMSDFATSPAPVMAAVAGWPVLIKSCKPLTAKELPGSDVFTRSPQPRTAVGVTDDGTKMFFVVADGRRKDVPGLTLADLASFMSDELGACSAMNLDGGGSSAMYVGNRIVNQPADGVERKVGDHLAVIYRSDLTCPAAVPAPMTSAQQ
jgi:exopolysaccharide biosynthesis protein